ncbi:MAG: NADH-quinone oxidoreductase subunit N [Sulfobacillus thermosulfidooxidans]|uniref:NADH-quinone oxidoreductase subunit N n=1 Tax=Sulfobacillus thermotolerans TaxID=338644 RepID=A0ABN5GZT8_9FIRM|nr:NADH-quinone oxidoreductase subunit N [Sulfobacillus sp. hq2]AUW93943.1 NADH dehydrogenase [Sulfobacillus thermotolerans]MCY0907644.1 NADH-quinone oxidoreductase subunit N [Sulfobacillus thermotolerans]POB11954.1 NADH-quinone oxidoreductase subunit N [Sulfobacillus sp. hq2]PSR35757.1 MAG: NADH-quinone oxidoreductase subunit N [Sulfobacillus thermosulfidooxidans]
MSATSMMMPEYLILATLLIAMLGIMVSRAHSTLPSWLGLLGSLGALWATVDIWTHHLKPEVLFNQSVSIDTYSLFVNVLVLIAAGSTILLGWQAERHHDEFPVLVLLSALGMMLLGMSANLVTLFLGIEILSLPLYILAASHRNSLGGEAGLKYLLLGAFSSGILLFGLALIYGASGSMNFTDFASAVSSHSPILGAGLVLALVGLLFKLAIVPFHMWVPDVYEGSPDSVTSFMAFGTKVGAAVILLRFLAYGFYLSPDSWGPILGYLALLTMIVGNLVALTQNDLKRLFGYSGIGHAGFLLVGVAVHSVVGARAMLFYLLPYGLAVIGAFAIITMISNGDNNVTIDDLRSLAYKKPWAAALFIVFMLSFAGIPLTGGFIGKFYLLQAALFAHQPGLAVGLVVGTFLGLGAYLRPLQAMFRRDGQDQALAGWNVNWAQIVVLVVAVVGTIGIGVYPTPVVHWVNQSANFFWLH